jgi:small-conductance mechanosensitive channel
MNTRTRDAIMNDPTLNTYERAQALQGLPPEPSAPPQPTADQSRQLQQLAASIAETGAALQKFEERAEQGLKLLPSLQEQVKALENGLTFDDDDEKFTALSTAKARLAALASFIAASPGQRQQLEANAHDALLRLELLARRIYGGGSTRDYTRGHALPVRLKMAGDYISAVLSGPGEPKST